MFGSFCESGSPFSVKLLPLVLLACFSPSLLAQQWPSKQLEAEANRHAEILWNTIMTHCGDSYYYTGSGLDSVTLNGEPREYANGLGGDITEYKDVRLIVIPPGAESTATQMNEADEDSHEAGTAVLLSKVFRSGDRETGQWSPWVDGPLSKIPVSAASNPRSLAALAATSFTDVATGLLGGAGMGGFIQIHMREVHGEWQYNLVGLTGFTVRSEYELMRGVTRPYSCNELDSTTPLSPAIAQHETVPELETRISNKLRMAAIRFGLGQYGYSREAEYIKRFLDTCALAQVPPGNIPDVNDPKFEICQRQLGRFAFIGSNKDISLAVNNPHNRLNPRAAGMHDVLMYDGYRPNTPWQPGEPTELTVAVFLPPPGPGILHSSNFDELISQAKVNGNASRPPAFPSSTETSMGNEQSSAGASTTSCGAGSFQVPAGTRSVSISAGVASGMLIQRTMPVYPPDAKAAGISGTVVLKSIISKNGTIQSLQVLSGPEALRCAAVQAVSTWRYRPYLLNGGPVEVNTTINITFSLGPEAMAPRQPLQHRLLGVATPVSPAPNIGSQPPQSNRLPTDQIQQAMSCADVTALSSPASTTPVRLKIVNSTRAVRLVYWVSYTRQKVFYMKIPPERFYRQPTFAGHIWLVTDPYGRCVEAFRAGFGDAEERINH